MGSRPPQIMYPHGPCPMSPHDPCRMSREFPFPDASRLPPRPHRAVTPRGLQQRRVELDERIVDRPLLPVTGVARRRGGQHRRLLREVAGAVERKVAPAALRKPPPVL